ncbi:MAG: DUF3549 family protein [Gammaproteobacteria bacterium]|nr:DUF3549 family protein [Gammaproteobacteria bacterium]
MTQLNGIQEFLQNTGSGFQVFDMGRRIQLVRADIFSEFEAGKIQWPWPLQQQAWLGMMILQPDSNDLVIWFVRLPLDNRGFLDEKIRKDFLQRLQQTEKQDDKTQNPYGFKPKQEQLAVFHAKAALQSAQPPSRFYAHARDYFAGIPGYDQWAFVGFQGIADIAARLPQDDNEQLLASALPSLPVQPFEALCQCIEHEAIGDTLASSLLQKLEQLLAHNETDAGVISCCLRALSGSSSATQAVELALSHPCASHADVLAAIAGRCWETLSDEKRMLVYLENLAQCSEGQDFFTAIVADLINIPGMQQPIHQSMRNPNRSTVLAKSIGGMFRQFSS